MEKEYIVKLKITVDEEELEANGGNIVDIIFNATMEAPFSFSIEDCRELVSEKAIMEIPAANEHLLTLPCKAGQKVFLLRKDIKSIVDGEITSINICEFASGMRIFIIDDNRYTDASFDKIGDIVFFTQEAAESALKEL